MFLIYVPILWEILETNNKTKTCGCGFHYPSGSAIVFWRFLFYEGFSKKDKGIFKNLTNFPENPSPQKENEIKEILILFWNLVKWHSFF